MNDFEQLLEDARTNMISAINSIDSITYGEYIQMAVDKANDALTIAYGRKERFQVYLLMTDIACSEGQYSSADRFASIACSNDLRNPIGKLRRFQVACLQFDQICVKQGFAMDLKLKYQSNKLDHRAKEVVYTVYSAGNSGLMISECLFVIEDMMKIGTLYLERADKKRTLEQVCRVATRRDWDNERLSYEECQKLEEVRRIAKGKLLLLD